MTIRNLVASIMFLTTLQLSPAKAADVLLQAVAVALTGSDSHEVVATNRTACAFDLKSEFVNPNRTLVERFYFNRIDVARTTFSIYQNSYSQWLQLDIHGYGDFAETIAGGSESLEMGTITYRKIFTSEADRVKRAWNYIYSHGCKSAASPF